MFDGLEFEQYFPNETEAIFYHLGRLVGYRGKKRKLTFGHLAAVVQLGRWFDPEAPQQVE